MIVGFRRWILELFLVALRRGRILPVRFIRGFLVLRWWRHRLQFTLPVHEHKRGDTLNILTRYLSFPMKCRLCACSCQKCKIGAMPRNVILQTELGNVFQHPVANNNLRQDRSCLHNRIGKGSILISFPDAAGRFDDLNPGLRIFDTIKPGAHAKAVKQMRCNLTFTRTQRGNKDE